MTLKFEAEARPVEAWYFPGKRRWSPIAFGYVSQYVLVLDSVGEIETPDSVVYNMVLRKDEYAPMHRAVLIGKRHFRLWRMRGDDTHCC